MKASELKASILQLAVSGKLVLQDPNDEPAGALLKRIKKEREALLKAGKIKKGKPLAEISEDEVPFEIPASWEWVRIGEISNYGNNASIDASKILDSDWILELEDVEKETGRILQIITKSQRNSLSTKHIFDVGDVLYSKLRPYLNKVVVPEQKGYCTSEILVVNFGKYVYPQFVQLFLMSPYFVAYANKCSSGMNLPRLGTEDGRKALFALPPLAEQQRIVARIGELMPLIEAYDKEEQKLTTLETKLPDALRQSILQYAVQGKLVSQKAEDGTAAELLAKIKKEREGLVKAGKIKKGTPLPPVSEEEKPFEIPSSWEWVRLGDIIQLISGRDLTPEEYTDKMCGIPYLIGASNVEDGIITVERWTEQPKVISLEHDLLLSCKGTIGKTAIQILPQAHIARQFMSLRPYFGIDIFYFKIFIDNYVPIFISEAKSMIPGISREDVLPILCPLPPLAEQRRIVERVQELMRLCGQLPTP